MIHRVTNDDREDMMDDNLQQVHFSPILTRLDIKSVFSD